MFFSCEDKDQINGAIIEPPQDEYIDSDLNPGGDSDGHVGNLYLNLVSDEVAAPTQEFWKFNYFHLTGGSHNGIDAPESEQDKLTLTPYNNSYYVSPEAFDLDDEGNPVDGSFVYVYNIYDYDDSNPDAAGYVPLPYTYVGYPWCSEDDESCAEEQTVCEECDDSEVYDQYGVGLDCSWESGSCQIIAGSNYAIISSLTTEVTENSTVVDVNSSLILNSPEALLI